MDIVFMISENSRTSENHVLILKLIGKLDLGRGEKKELPYQILPSTIHGKI